MHARQAINPSPNPHQLPRNPRYQSLDLWRGIACLLVVVIHSTAIFRRHNPDYSSSLIWLTTFGWIGVPIFFVISGYCISATADSTRIKGHSVRTYFTRRIKRIYPPYWIAITIGIGLFVALELILHTHVLSANPEPQWRPWWFSPMEWLGNLTLTETWRSHVLGSDRGLFLQQAWTLCYEEQFYLVVGLILLCASTHFFGAVIAITIGVLLAMLLLPPASISGFFLDGQWLAFAAGILVYYAVNYSHQPGRVLAIISLILAGSIAAYLAVGGLSIGLFFALLLLLLHPFDAWTRRQNYLAPFFWCGTMCYSLYLVHMLVVTMISRIAFDAGYSSPTATILFVLPICITASLVAGWMFYLGIERRFLNSKRAATQAASAIELSNQIAA
jgi:peptidoglycan/LPS O-acetylase OafA/YrhL